MPRLLPGILVLSQRARYFSLHAFLLNEYQRRRLPLNNNDLSSFIKLREFEYAVAVQLCPRGCGERPVGMVGKTRAAPAVEQHADAIPRRESVESPLGGYGLYYRSPMIDIGMVVPRGSALGEAITPLDVLDPNGPGPALADAFGSAITDTSYFREHMFGASAIPREALEELADAGLPLPAPRLSRRAGALAPGTLRAASARLREGDEAALPQLRAAAARTGKGARNRRLKRRIHASGLGRLPRRPRLAMEHCVRPSPNGRRSQRRTGGKSRCHRSGLTSCAWPGNAATACRRTSSTPSSAPNSFRRGRSTSSAEYSKSPLRSRRRRLPTRLPPGPRIFHLTSCGAGPPRPTQPQPASFYSLPCAAESQPQAAASPGWLEIGAQSSERQPSFLHFLYLFDRHLEAQPTLAQTLVWLTSRFVINAHEQIAYSKLPEFTFRFRWEEGRLRFYTLGLGRFRLADIRREAMAQISEDVGLWQGIEGVPELTSLRPPIHRAGVLGMKVARSFNGALDVILRHDIQHRARVLRRIPLPPPR